MKQNSGDKRCVAIVTALATKRPVKDFEDWCNHKPPYSELEMATFLFMNGLACNLGLGKDYFYSEIDVSDSEGKEILLSPKFELTAEHEVTISFKIKDIPAIFIVESGSDETHALYWDGEMLYDPNPMTPNGRPFSSYKILKYFPIIKVGVTQ